MALNVMAYEPSQKRRVSTMIRPWAVFSADFEDDTEEDGQSITRGGGRNVAEAIGIMLARLGCKASTPEQVGEDGWTFDVNQGGKRFWCQVTSLHPQFYLLLEDVYPKDQLAHGNLLVDLDEGLRTDPRFHDLLWYLREDGLDFPPEGGGAASPLGILAMPEARPEKEVANERSVRQKPRSRALVTAAITIAGLWIAFVVAFFALRPGITFAR
jgi:hypothetical protein